LLKTLRNGDFVHHSPFCFALDGDEIVFRSVGAQTEGVGLFVQNSEVWRLCFITVLFALLLMVMKSCFGLWGAQTEGVGLFAQNSEEWRLCSS
jgi:hypothetical protein